MDSNTRTGREFRECWDLLQREAEQCCTYLGKELDGTIAIGPDIAIELKEGGSSRQAVTEQREELREAVVREALLRHPIQTEWPCCATPSRQRGQPLRTHSWTSSPLPGSLVFLAQRLA